MPNSTFKRFDVDGSDRSMLPLIITNKVQLSAPAPIPIVALYLESPLNNSTGKVETTQWALTFDQVEWLIENLPKVYDDAKDEIAASD